jgi:DNA-directed RNA polymerase subunit beta'
MTPASNIFSPANGQPIITPSKDMVLGCYYLTAALHGTKAGRVFYAPSEVVQAFAGHKVGVHSGVTVRLPAGRAVVGEAAEVPGAAGGHRRVRTTAGRVLFNDALPAGLPFYDLALTSRNLSRIIADCHRLLGREATLALLERVKEIGFREATRSGLSFAADDLRLPGAKGRVLAETEQAVARVQGQFDRGDMTAEERSARVIGLWTRATSAIRRQLMAELAGDRRAGQGVNPIHAMVASGARGSAEQLTQLAGMRGLMTRPSGEVLETPIKASFREGLSSLEYFSSTHGARKGWWTRR